VEVQHCREALARRRGGGVSGAADADHALIYGGCIKDQYRPST